MTNLLIFEYPQWLLIGKIDIFLLTYFNPLFKLSNSICIFYQSLVSVRIQICKIKGKTFFAHQIGNEVILLKNLDNNLRILFLGTHWSDLYIVFDYRSSIKWFVLQPKQHFNHLCWISRVGSLLNMCDTLVSYRLQHNTIL